MAQVWSRDWDKLLLASDFAAMNTKAESMFGLRERVREAMGALCGITRGSIGGLDSS